MRILINFFCLWLISKTAFATAQIITVEHFIPTQSLAPSLRNQVVQLYLREVKSTKVKSTDKNSLGAVLFIHGGGTPSTAAFDVPYKDYSWMAYLAKEGFAVYALDLTGYGRSTRPPEMNNPCYLSKKDQQQFIPSLIAKTCAKTYTQMLTSNESDWADMDAAINFILAQQKIKSLALIGWSQGGPRSLSYSQLHPGKINNLVLFAPAYGRDWPLTPPAEVTENGLMDTQNYSEFVTGWDKQLGCAGQVEESVRAVIWKEMLASDSLGATWGEGVRRAPEQQWHWGFNRAIAAKTNIPALLITGEFDQQVPPKTVHELYEDLGSAHKVIIDLACSSHRANWETNHLLLFKASADWLKNKTIAGTSLGTLKLDAHIHN